MLINQLMKNKLKTFKDYKSNKMMTNLLFSNKKTNKNTKLMVLKIQKEMKTKLFWKVNKNN